MLTEARRSRGVGWIAWIFACAVAIFAVWRLAGISAGFPLAPLVALTPYAVLAAGLIAAVALLLHRWAAGVVIATAALLLGIAVVPRAIPDSQPEVSGGTEVRLLAFNALFGRADPDSIVEVAERTGADVLVLSELTPELAGRLDRAGLTEIMPAFGIAAQDGVEGVGIWSRFPVERLDAGDEAAARAVVATLTLPGGGEVELHAVHPGVPSLPGGAWEAGLASLPEADSDGTIRIIAGDFNATLDHPELRDVISSGYADAADATGNGLRPTWPVGRKLPPLVIDHILADRRVAIDDYGVYEIPGSDHRAIVATLLVPAAAP